MKKARTLLAIWLALILTLTLFPTALAVEENGETGNPTGTDPTESQTVNVSWGYSTEQISTVDGELKIVPTDKDFTFKFKANEGYQITGLDILIGGVDTNNTLSTPDSEGVYSYTIEKEKLTGNVEIKITAEALPEKQGDGSDGSNPDGPPPQGGTPSPGDGNGAESEFTISWAVDESFDKTKIENWPSGAWATKNRALSLPKLTYPGFTFQGWANKDGPLLTGKQTFAADTTLTAKFVRNYTFTFAGLDGITSTTPTLESAAPGATIPLPAAPTARGKEFKHWSISGDGITTTTVGANGTFPLPAGEPQEGKTAITITAIWSDLPKITINFQPEAGAKSVSGMPDSDVSYENEVYKLPSTRPSRHDGSYEFASWRLKVEGTIYNFQPGNSVNWKELGIKDGTTVTFIADFAHHYYADKGDDDDKPSKPSKPTYDEYRIRATCSDGGWVSPAGSTYVREGRNLTVTFAPYKGYAIDGVYIDGVLDNRYDGSYTFRDVDENHTIYVRYVRDSGSSGGSSGGGSHWDDDTSPKTGDTSAPLSMGLGVGSLALIAFLVARKMRRA